MCTNVSQEKDGPDLTSTFNYPFNIIKIYHSIYSVCSVLLLLTHRHDLADIDQTTYDTTSCLQLRATKAPTYLHVLIATAVYGESTIGL